MGTVPGRPGSMHVSAKTRSWEQAESLARKYEITAAGGDEVKEARGLAQQQFKSSNLLLARLQARSSLLPAHASKQ